MYYLGIILALGAVIALAIVESGRDFILTVYDLSPEITVMILIGYFYPLFLFAYTFFVLTLGLADRFSYS